MRSTWRLILTFAIGTMLASAGLVQVAAAQESDTTGTKEKVVFTYGGTGEPSSLNPMAGYLAVDFYFWTASYHLLVDFGLDLGVQNGSGLVTNIETSADSMTFTYSIRDDITWSDGERLTTDDVAFTLNLYKQNHAYLPQGYLTLIDGDVEVVDATTIRFHTTEPTGLYTGNSPYMYDYILPEHIWKDFEKPKQFENVPSIGSGPFVIEEYKVGEYVRMVRNPYWEGPEPAIDEIIYQIFKNEDALSQALRNGEVDFAYLSAPNIFNSLKGVDNIETVNGTIPAFDEIAMNTGSAFQEANDYYTPHGDGHEALTDVNVRRAIRMAIDSQTLVDKVLLGYGSAGTTIIPPVSVVGARWEPTGDEVIPWDIPGANALLDENGYKDTDGDGVREMPGGGEPLEFRYYVRTSDQTTIDAAPFVQKWLEDIGIKAEVTAMSSGRLGDEINAGTYDLFDWGWIPDPDPDSALNWFTCDSRPPDGSSYGNNDPYYCNPEYDKLFAEQRAELDPDKRWEIVHEMQKIFYNDAAYAVKWYSPTLQAYRTDAFTGYQSQPPGNGDLLEGYGGPSSVWWKLTPVGTGGGSSQTRGIPAVAWIGILAGVVIILAAMFLSRRRKAGEEEA